MWKLSSSEFRVIKEKHIFGTMVFPTPQRLSMKIQYTNGTLNDVLKVVLLDVTKVVFNPNLIICNTNRTTNLISNLMKKFLIEFFLNTQGNYNGLNY